MSESIGLGASLAGYSYLPQIRHWVIRHWVHERCSAGISRGAFSLWLLTSILMTIHALLQPAVLGAVQIGAISIILVYSARYRGFTCPSHALNPARDSL